MDQAQRLALLKPGILLILCVSVYVFMCLVMSGAAKAMKWFWRLECRQDGRLTRKSCNDSYNSHHLTSNVSTSPKMELLISSSLRYGFEELHLIRDLNHTGN